MSSFGELVLVLGDLHIPHRVASISPAFQRMLVPNKMQHVICTGNVVTSAGENNEIVKMLHSLAPNVHIVQGDMDSDDSLPEYKVITVGAFKIAIIHGHQIIPYNDKDATARMRRKLGNVDILITGNTHRNHVKDNGEFHHINPGSITGAYTSVPAKDSKPIVPSFILLAVQDAKIVCYVYELNGEKVDVSKTEFTKKSTQQDEVTETKKDSALLQSLLT